MSVVRFLYTMLFYSLLPLLFLRLLWRSLRAPDYRQRWGERLGRFEAAIRPGGIWVHAVSVGEVVAIVPLIRRLLEQNPARQITLTTTTPTGSAQVRSLLGDQVFHVYFPFDVPWALEGFIKRVRPDQLLMVETEIWPNLLAACRRHGISSLLANARLSKRSARRYERLGSFTRETFAAIDRVAAQSAADASRFQELGVPAEQVVVTGSIKFDMKIPASLEERVEVLRREWAGRPAWVAASTHEGEDELVLTAHRMVLERVPNALLVLVPRHPERFDRVANLCKRQGFPIRRRSARSAPKDRHSVFLGDTMGELMLMLGAADAAFIGGSLVKTGGHNMLEAAAQGVPVCFGPYMFNFPVISQMMTEHDAAVRVLDETELGHLIVHWLTDASRRSQIGENGRRMVEANRGALERLLALLN